MITAPYNFVPLSEKVVMPFWAKHVSHDTPFQESQSGVLEVTIKAESPIYVRNGVSKNALDSDKNAFNNIDNKYFIPGSSIKGMLRSVIEIMSFGRMSNKVNDHRYSVRDFQNKELYKILEITQTIECGWLKKIGEEYFLQECGKAGRISQESIDIKFNTKISSFFSKKENLKESILLEKEKIDAKSAHFKYLKFNSIELNNNFNITEDKYQRKVCDFSASGKPGTIVFTGQPGERYFNNIKNKWEGKHLEFVFFESKNDFNLVDSKIIDNFFFAYFQHEKPQQKEDWKYRYPQLKNGIKIPVFFRKDLKGNIIDMGLSFLYKITYENSIKNAIDKYQEKADSFDLAETIFGYTDRNDALKGRVHIGHAFVKGNVKPLDEQSEILAGPKASYYPNYIEQKPNKEGAVSSYKTFMDETSKINGWKRYPIRKSNEPIQNKGTDNISTKFSPLPSGSEFTLQINYHNLRKEELGALISAITFHGTNDLYHSIGTGKPLGYGKVSFEITNLNEAKRNELLKAFELYMDYELGNSTPLWFQSPQLKELFAMAKAAPDDSKLKYLELNDFVKAKGKTRNDPKFALQRYSSISNNQVIVNPLSTELELQIAIANYQTEKEIFDNKLDISIQKQKIVFEKKEFFEKALKEKKKDLLEKLNSRKKTIELEELENNKKIEAAEKLNKKLDVQKNAMELGFQSPDFNVNDRQAFDNLGKLIIRYAQNLHNLNEAQLKNQIVNTSLLQSKDFDIVIQLIKEIYLGIKGKKDKEKWLNVPLNKNPFYLKIKWWIGENKANSLFEELEKNRN